MMGYPRALAARYEIARTVAAWPRAKPTDTPGRYPRAWCPKLPRDLPACRSRIAVAVPYRVPCPTPSRRDTLAAPAWPTVPGGIPACRYRAGPTSQPPNLARARYPRALTAEPCQRASAPPIPRRTVPSTDPNRRYRRALAAHRRPLRASGHRTRYAQLPRRPNKGQPNHIEHPFEFAGPDRTPVRPNTCSNLHPAMLGKVTRITGNRFHSLPAFNRQAGRFQSSKDCQPETKPNRTLVLSHTCSTVVAVNRGMLPNIAKMVRHTAVSY